MKMVRRVIYWVTAFALVFVTFWFGYTRQPATVQVEKKPVPVEVEPVTTGSIEETLNLTGWIKASQVVEVTSKVSGRVESLRVVCDTGEALPVEEGLLVKKNRQLAVIDHDVYLAQVAAAQAGVKAAEVQLAEAQREKKRITALFESGSATEQEKDKVATAADLAAANLSLAQANLDLAQVNLRESTIVSPIDGIVTAKYIDEGNFIAPGQRIVAVADVSTVRVIVAIAEKYGAKIQAGTLARIKVDTFPDKYFDAQVYSIYPAFEPQSHTMQIEIRLKNDESLLKSGMFASVTLIPERRQDVVVIPRDVILGGKVDKPYVYVVENGAARKVIVNIGIAEEARCEITGGLKGGEQLVVNGMQYLADGCAVEVVRLEDIK